MLRVNVRGGLRCARLVECPLVDLVLLALATGNGGHLLRKECLAVRPEEGLLRGHGLEEVDAWVEQQLAVRGDCDERCLDAPSNASPILYTDQPGSAAPLPLNHRIGRERSRSKSVYTRSAAATSALERIVHR